jgi:hypothetical protein
MMYRLVQDHPLYGLRGLVFEQSAYKAVKFADKVLFEPIESFGEYFVVYKKVGTVEKTWLLEDVRQIVDFFDDLHIIDGWVKQGFVSAAESNKPYQFSPSNNDFFIKMTVYGD